MPMTKETLIIVLNKSWGSQSQVRSSHSIHSLSSSPTLSSIAASPWLSSTVQSKGDIVVLQKRHSSPIQTLQHASSFSQPQSKLEQQGPSSWSARSCSRLLASWHHSLKPEPSRSQGRSLPPHRPGSAAPSLRPRLGFYLLPCPHLHQCLHPHGDACLPSFAST